MSRIRGADKKGGMADAEIARPTVCRVADELVLVREGIAAAGAGHPEMGKTLTS
jgi:hypothetical protein